MQKLLVALLAGLVLASCVPATPQARIQQNPRLFADLSTRQQALVQQGQIDRGMSPDAVYLAWGSPSASYQGSKQGELTERWDYAGYRTVPVTHFHGSYGYGYGRFAGPYGHYRYSGYGFALGPDLASIPYRVATVVFINHRVDSWERAR